MSKLFVDIDEFKQFVMVNVSYDLSDVAPALGVEEERQVVKYIGRDQFEQLASAYASSSMTPAEEELLTQVRLPLANFALSSIQFTRSIQESASGSTNNETKERKPASPLEIARRKREILTMAYRGVDVLLNFLQRNKADYPLWVASEAYVNTKSLFIQTTDRLAELLSVERSHALFLQYVPILTERQKVIRGNLGKAYFDELKDQVLNDTLTPENELIVTDYVQPAMAYLAHEKAVALLAYVHPFGVYVFEELSLDPHAKVKAALSKEKDAIRDEMKSQYSCVLDEMLTYLADNINDYPTYRDSPAYTPPEEENTDACACDDTDPCKQSTNAKVGYI